MKCSPEIKNRIKRATGQMNGVLNLMEKESTCEEILIQLKAVKTSIEKAIGLISATNLIQSIEINLNQEVSGVKEAIDLLLKSI